MNTTKQAQLIGTITDTEAMIELNKLKIIELESKNRTLEATIKLLKSKLDSPNSGFGDSIDNFKDGFGIDLK